MTFKLQPKPIFTTDVLIPVPGDAPQKLNVQFLHKRKKDLDAWAESIKEGRDQGEALLEVMEGWDADGDYSHGSLTNLLEDYPGAGLALQMAYYQESIGAERKN